MSLGQMLNSKLGIDYDNQGRAEQHISDLMEDSMCWIRIISPEFNKGADERFYSPAIGEILSQRLLNMVEVSILLNEPIPSNMQASVDTLLKENDPFFYMLNSELRKKKNQPCSDGIIKSLNVYFSKEKLADEKRLIIDNNFAKLRIKKDKFKGIIYPDNYLRANRESQSFIEMLKQPFVYKIDAHKLFYR